MYWNLIWKSPWFVPFGANLALFEPKSAKPVTSAPRAGGQCDQYNICLYIRVNFLHWESFPELGSLFSVAFYEWNVYNATTSCHEPPRVLKQYQWIKLSNIAINISIIQSWTKKSSLFYVKINTVEIHQNE